MKEIDLKIFKLLEILKSAGMVASEYEFAISIGKAPQHVNNIKNRKDRHFTIKDVVMMQQLYNVNMNWLFGNETNVFNLKSTQNSTQNE